MKNERLNQPKGFDEMTPEELTDVKKKIEEEIVLIEQNYRQAMKDRDNKLISRYKRRLESKEKKIKKLNDLLSTDKREARLKASKDSYNNVTSTAKNKKKFSKIEKLRSQSKLDRKKEVLSELHIPAPEYLKVIMLIFVVIEIISIIFLETMLAFTIIMTLTVLVVAYYIIYVKYKKKEFLKSGY